MSNTHNSTTASASSSTSPADASATSDLHSTWQLANIVLRVRDDIDVLVRDYGGQPTYIIEDELTSRFYRIGLAEYTFLTQLDGTRTFATALGRTAAILQRDALTNDRAATFCKWLVESGLASTEQSRSVVRLLEQAEQGERRRNQGRWSVLSQRFPLYYPGRLTELLGRGFGFLFSGPALVAWFLLVTAGFTVVVLNWQDFRSHAVTIVAPHNQLWLLATWLGLKLLHEAAHSIACHRFGGTVREAGILFILLVPLPYVDVTSAWRFASRWPRIVTSAAGMIAELAVAAVAAIVWSQAEPGLVSQHAVNIIVSAGVTTVLFNANPLMRFDGYYIFADLLALPNLAAHGQQSLRNLGRRWGLGLPEHDREYPEGRRSLVLAYGIAAFLWRIVVCIGLILAADALFYGLGTLLAVIAMTLWWVLPIARLVRFVTLGNEREQPSQLRFAILVLAAATVATSVLRYVPWYSSAVAPVVVDYHPLIRIRTPVSGFVDELHVASADTVTAGQTLMVLRNEELESTLAEVTLQIAQAQHRTAGYLNNHEIAAHDVELENLQALRQRADELRTRLDALTVIAPSDGLIVSPNLAQLRGTYVRSGTPLLTLAPEARVQLLALIDQRQEDLFRKQVGKELSVHLSGTGAVWKTTQLLEMAPRASRTVPHPALTASAGGALAVRLNQNSVDPAEDSEERYELLEPHFLARLTAPPRAFAGQSGELTFLANDDSVSSRLKRLAGSWWNARQEAVMRQIYQRR